MEISKILDSKKTEKFVLGIAVLFCFLVHIAVLRQFTNWYSSDVVGYLSHAATFSGRDWSGVMRNATSFYSWGYSVLLTIPMLFTSDITLVYHCAILFNALLCCGILLLCYGIGKRIAPEVNRYYVILCATAVSVYTSYIFQGAVMLSEIFLYFFVFVNIYCLLRYIETEKNIWGILTGLSVGYTYIIHNRAIAVVIAYVMVAIIWGLYKKSWKQLAVMITPLVIMLLINMGTLNYLELHEKQGQEYVKNTYEAQFSKIEKKMGFYGMLSMLKCALGEIWYMLIGTIGIVGVGIYSVVRRLRNALKKRENKFLLYIFLLLFLLGTLGVSILFCAQSQPPNIVERYERYIYGRYWETIFGIFIFIGFIEVYSGKKRELLNSLILISGCLSIIIEYMTRIYQNNAYNYWAIPAVLTTFFDSERRFTVMASSIIGILLMILLFYWFSQDKKGYSAMGIALWMSFCVFSGYNSVYGVASIYKEMGSVTNMPTYNVDFNDICTYIRENNIDQFAVCTGDGYRAVSFQVMNPNSDVIGIVSEESWVEGKGVYIVDKVTSASVHYENIVYENGTYLIFIE